MHRYFEIKLHINNGITCSEYIEEYISIFKIRLTFKIGKNDIIETVYNGRPPWISPIVVVPKKNDSIKIWVDMRLHNKAIKLERYITPTIDDITTELNGAPLFSSFFF